MWLEEYNIDGIRTDGTVYVRRMDVGSDDLPHGWTLLQWLSDEVRDSNRWRVMIAEDLQNDEWLTRPTEDNGAGFHSQWDANFCHPVREMLAASSDSDRSAQKLAEILSFCYNGDPFQSVIYTESHDEVANGSARMVSEIDPGDPEGEYAVKRALLGIAIAVSYTHLTLPTIYSV